MTGSPRLRRAPTGVALGVVLAAWMLSSCTSPTTSAGAPPSDTVSMTPIVSGTSAPLITEQSSPAVAAETTLPETTQVPTTTIEATTTTAVPANIVDVGVFPVPIVAVGMSSGPDTAVVQLRLVQLGFWVALADGNYGLTTKQAVMAFQKYLGLDASGAVDDTTAAYLTQFSMKAHGQADTGTLVEVDKARQLLFVVVDGAPLWAFNASTGNGLPYDEPDKSNPAGPNLTGVALTPDGLWKVNRERPDGWWEGDLGKIYRPKYFHGGIAVHGSNSVPNHAASHGCVRVSVPAMDFIWDSGIIPLKMTVWVHS